MPEQEAKVTTYYIFHSTAETQVAITDDRTGGKIAQAGVWLLGADEKRIHQAGWRASHWGSAPHDVIAGVSRNGYYLWPQPKKSCPMPTGPKSEKRAADWIGAAVKVMRIATGEEPEDQGLETEKKEEARQEHDA